jgi:hypothetical protein
LATMSFYYRPSAQATKKPRLLRGPGLVEFALLAANCYTFKLQD